MRRCPRLPTEFRWDVDEVAAAATDVEADTVSVTDQPSERVAGSVITVGVEKGVVLIGQAVVQGAAHDRILATGVTR